MASQGGRVFLLGGPGGGLLFRALGRSTMGAAGFHGRVRDGIGWDTRAVGPPGRPSRRIGERGQHGMSPRARLLILRLGWGTEGSSIERLGPVSCTCRHASTPGLSTWWSSTALGETWFRGGFPA